jgi:lipid II:glycine glycyltransferase (peptidoglycan interpeptide bridge formation enzyme)
VRVLLDYTLGHRIWQAMSGSPGNVMPGQCANWAAIKWAKARGYLEYDLGGVPSDLGKSPGQRGIYEYKRGFGGEVVELVGEFEWSPIRAYQWAFRRFLHARRKLRRGRSTQAPDTLTEGEHAAGMGG